MSIKLHAPLGHGRTNKILVAAALAHVPVELVNTQLNDKNIQVFQQSFPFGKVPVLETTEGNLFESNAILRYLARHSQDLYGTSPYQQGLVDQWLDVTINELETDAVAAAIQVLGYIPANPTQYQNSLQAIGHTLQIVNKQLGSTKFITGATLTVADICLAQVVSFTFTYLIGEEQRNKYPQLLGWLSVVTALPEWQAQFGRSRFVKTPFGIKEEAKSK